MPSLVFFSPGSTQVISRSGDKCVVALCDQWYLTYGDPDWRDQVKEFVSLPFAFFVFSKEEEKNKHARTPTHTHTHKHAHSLPYTGAWTA